MEVWGWLCRDVTVKAYEVWAAWVGKGLCLELQAALQSDAGLASSTPLQAWEETIIAQVLPPTPHPYPVFGGSPLLLSRVLCYFTCCCL